MDECMDITDESISPPTRRSFRLCDICRAIGVWDSDNITYRVSKEQSVWVCARFSDDFWRLICTAPRITEHSPLRKEDFTICCSIAVDSFYQQQQLTDSDLDPFSDEEIILCPSPVLCLATPGKGSELPLALPLFAQLFDQEAVLHTSSTNPNMVCLIGLPDGRVFWWMKSSSSDKARLLCHMQQPVVDILSGPDFSLLLVGQHGKVICVSVHEGKVKYSLIFLSGLVTSCCYWNNTLFYTTSSKQLWQSVLIYNKKGQAEITQSLLPAVGAKRVKINLLSEKVWYINADNVPHEMPAMVSEEPTNNQRKQLRWLTDTISNQALRMQSLAELNEKYASILHDLTCAAWLLTPERCGLQCCFEVLPVPGQGSEFIVRVVFKELAKLCATGQWSASCSLREADPTHAVRILRSMPVSHDVVQVDMPVVVSLESKKMNWSNQLRPPLALTCSLLFGGVNISDFTPSVSCPEMQFPLKDHILDELCFIRIDETCVTPTPGFPDSVDKIVLSIAKGKGRSLIESSPGPSLPAKVQCNIRMFLPTGESLHKSNDAQALSILKLLLPANINYDKGKTFSLLGHKIQFLMPDHEDDKSDKVLKVTHLNLETDSISVLSAARKSTTQRLQVNCLNSKAKLSFSKEAYLKAQRLYSELQLARTTQSLETVVQFYLKLRNELSANLPYF